MLVPAKPTRNRTRPKVGRIKGKPFDFHQLQLVPLSPEVIYRCGELPKVHTDPFDRLLVAHAMQTGMFIHSPDKSLSLLGAARIW